MKKDKLIEVIEEKTIIDWDGNITNVEEVADVIVAHIEASKQMNICKTCIHWKMPQENDVYNAIDMCRPLDPDNFEPMKRGFEVRICKHPAQTFAEPPIEDNGFGLADASEFFACLATAENFGCVRHEGKDQ